MSRCHCQGIESLFDQKTGAGNSGTLYIDGVAQDSFGGSLINTFNQTSDMVIGAWLANSFFLNGKVDEVRFWNLSRSQVQIQATMNDTLGPQYYTASDSGLVAYYRFDQLENLGAGGDGLTDDVRDLSVNGTHGDLVGNAQLIFSNAVLPVELTLFSASTFEQSIHLDWKTIGFVAGKSERWLTQRKAREAILSFGMVKTMRVKSWLAVIIFIRSRPEIFRLFVNCFCSNSTKDLSGF